MTPKQKGTRFEHKVRDAFIVNGYGVIRAAGSKGAVDLLAVRLKSDGTQEALGIQCKASNKKSLPSHERKQGEQWNQLFSKYLVVYPKLRKGCKKRSDLCFYDLDNNEYTLNEVINGKS